MLGEIPWLSWKSKSTQKREEEEYAQWAFPYGDPQRQKVEALLAELIPGEKTQLALISFLTCKELFSRAYKNPNMYGYALRSLKKDLKRYKNVVRKRDINLYAAAAITDTLITSELDYPPIEKVRALAEEFAALPDEKNFR